MEAKSYLSLLEFISYRLQNLEENETWLGVDNQTEIVEHYLEIEKYIKKYSQYSEIKTFFYMKK